MTTYLGRKSAGTNAALFAGIRFGHGLNACQQNGARLGYAPKSGEVT